MVEGGPFGSRAYGENVVMRILDQSKVMIELEQLGMLPQALERFTKAYSQAHGAVLVTGPTGSGKSTSLYGALNQLNTIEKNIITIEDPVEYQLDGVTQVQVAPKSAEIAAAQFLYPYTNKRRLAKIENARVPQVYFRAFRDAIERAVIYDRVVISILPEVQYPDMVAEVADFLLRLDDVEWACAIGTYNQNLHVSLRTTEREVNAGDILQRVLGSDSAGGHDMTAGGRVPVPKPGRAAAAKAAEGVRNTLLTVLGSSGAPRPLVD